MAWPAECRMVDIVCVCRVEWIPDGYFTHSDVAQTTQAHIDRENYNKCFSHSTIQRLTFVPTPVARHVEQRAHIQMLMMMMMATTRTATGMTMKTTDRTPHKLPMSMHLVVFFPLARSPPFWLLLLGMDNAIIWTMLLYFKHDREPVAILCK